MIDVEFEKPLPIENQVIVKLENVHKHVPTAQGRLDILSAIYLTINSAESLAILGASGSGKSTLLSLMAGLDVPSEGKIYLAGESLTDLDEDGRAELRGRNVGFVFQSFQLLSSLTALQNVMLPLELAAVNDADDVAEKYLRRVGLGNRLSHYPTQLSGGEQQRVALARAFVTSPRILFADEPTGNLDSVTGKQIIDLLFELNREQKTTLVLVTHDQALASQCRRLINLDTGRIVE